MGLFIEISTEISMDRRESTYGIDSDVKPSRWERQEEKIDETHQERDDDVARTAHVDARKETWRIPSSYTSNTAVHEDMEKGTAHWRGC